MRLCLPALQVTEREKHHADSKAAEADITKGGNFLRRRGGGCKIAHAKYFFTSLKLERAEDDKYDSQPDEDASA